MLVILQLEMECSRETDVGIIDLNSKDPVKLADSDYMALKTEVLRAINSSDPYAFAQYDSWPTHILEDYPVTGTIGSAVALIVG